MTTYKVLDAAIIKSLEVQVNAYLRKGWKLHGNTFTDNGKFYQALTIIHKKTVKAQ